ncbi:hypothetical protein vBVnaSL3_5 [Vibrio phage vB_VnaS-L3]|nr:hypothetical protein vBVnaSL3_5 [Vibrio phage vB_VnaS-L3]
MAIPTITPYGGVVANPDGSQTQTEFTQNMFDQLSYEAQLASELNATVNATNTTASEVDGNAAIAQNSSDAAQAAANFEGDFTAGVTSAVKGKSYLYGGNVWLCLQNTTSTPSTSNAAWKLSVGEQYVTEAQEDLLPPGSKLFKGSDGVTVKNGDTVPVGTTHLRVLVGGLPTILVAWDTLTLPATITSIPISDNGLGGYDVVTDQGTFEFISLENYKYRLESDIRGWGAIEGGDLTDAIDAAREYKDIAVIPFSGGTTGQSDVNVNSTYVFKEKSELTITTNDTVAIPIPRNDLRVERRAVKDAWIKGNDQRNNTSTNRDGIVDEGSLNLSIERPFIRDLRYGIHQKRSMETSISDAVLQTCYAGLILENDASDGGANAQYYNVFRLQGNTVGTLVRKNASGFPMHNIFFSNVLAQAQRGCGLAIIAPTSGGRDLTTVSMSNFHFELNALDGVGDKTVDGTVVPNCDFYVSGGVNAILRDGEFSSSLTGGSLILANGAKVFADNVTGWGGGLPVTDDGTCTYHETGNCDLTRAFEVFMVNYGRPIFIRGATRYGVPKVFSNRSISNNYIGANNDPMVPEGLTTGGSTQTSVLLSNGWTVRQITFAASPGSAGGNFFRIPSGAILANSSQINTALVMSDVDAEFSFGDIQSGGFIGTAKLKAGVWTRLVMIATTDGTPPSDRKLYIWPNGSEGAVLNVTALQMTDGTTEDVANVYENCLFNPLGGDLL